MVNNQFSHQGLIEIFSLHLLSGKPPDFQSPEEQVEASKFRRKPRTEQEQGRQRIRRRLLKTSDAKNASPHFETCCVNFDDILNSMSSSDRCHLAERRCAIGVKRSASLFFRLNRLKQCSFILRNSFQLLLFVTSFSSKLLLR